MFPHFTRNVNMLIDLPTKPKHALASLNRFVNTLLELLHLGLPFNIPI